MSLVVTSRIKSPWPTKDEISVNAMQLSDTSFARNTLESQFFRGGYRYSTGQPSTYDTRYSSVSYPFFNIPVYSNPRTYAMEPLSREELERFQKLSNDYEPEVQGPLVSPKQSSQIISAEYSNADPTFVTKTNALSVTHPFTRTMKGDGNCGWRAVAFGYFENLFFLRDTIKVQSELSRIKSMNALLDQVGHQEYLYETFVDATEETFGQVIDAIQKGVPDEGFLVDIFNDFSQSMSIITHFRLLTGAWMKLDQMRYQAFLSTPVDQYCATRIEPAKTEIDEVGLQALVDSVIEGSDIAVEILYLDRSQGDAVTPHLLTPNRQSLATIKLLYRPGHYDILYSAEPTVHMSPIVNLQYGMSTDFSPWDSAALGFDANPSLMAIPGLMMDPSAFPSVSSSMMASPQQPQYFPSPPPQHEFYSPSISPPVPSTVSSPAPPSLPLSLPTTKSSDGPQIRLNPLVMKPNLSHSLPVTTPFKKTEIDVPARLRRAILQNDVLLVKRIIKNNPAYLQNPDFEDGSNTSLHLAAIKGHLNILRLLLSLGHDSCTPNIDRTGYDSAPGISLNVDGSTALHLAAAHSHPDCVDLLCRMFSHTIDWKDNEGRTPLMLAAQSSNPSHAPVSTNSSAHIPPPTGRRRRAVSTNSAMASEDIATITVLLSYTASVIATDHSGNTALHYASAWGNLKAVRALLAAGTPPLSPNKANHTPLDYSITKQAAQYFQSIVNEFESSTRSDDTRKSWSSDHHHHQQQQQSTLKLNTAAVRAIATPPEESKAGGTRMLGSPMSSPVKSNRNLEQRQQMQYPSRHQHQSSNTSPVKKNFGGLRLVIDTESAEYADVDDVPSTAKRIERPSIDEPRTVQS